MAASRRVAKPDEGQLGLGLEVPVPTAREPAGKPVRTARSRRPTRPRPLDACTCGHGYHAHMAGTTCLGVYSPGSVCPCLRFEPA
jgi:hypothetical protein